jgi:hypothetical protein
MLMSPLLAACAGKEGWLPKWLWWFQTPDNWLYGDDGHMQRWGMGVFAKEGTYWQMVSWLFRNPAYGFEWDGPLAATTTSDMPVVVHGDPWIKNRQDAKEGAYFCRVGPYWNYKLIIHLRDDLAFMLEFGWKLQGYAQGRESSGKAMFVFSPRLTAFYP